MAKSTSFSVPIVEAIAKYRAVEPNDTLVKTARSLCLCFRD
ncbi:MAG: hypothetical protein O4861_03945 [Trichodesmium sp. St16_bin4-tuft]|nr:hypothetical protein [Trichodesmium sp. St5_bin8]MDE5078549.1 hypothetical protein [Trichodesmium sp. St2_bin6]MDE5097535.1 hypothetical protein [Trichodesmium sp. St16_bin4-tuft]MDE5103537.1 hypothetical protein [Trichodesmium sp. St19_bin2]